MKRVIIIGAGIGGLATALRLAHAGFQVTVMEKNRRVGGKMNAWDKDGYRFDTGPSLLTMPFVLKDLFASVGSKLENYLEILPVEPLCRYTWPDGTRLDASADLQKTEREMARVCDADAAHLRAFLQHGKEIYDAASEPFLFSEFIPLNARGVLRALRRLPVVAKIDALRSLDEAVREYFVDPRVRQLFNRFATYNGSSPYRAPATLCLIPYVEFTMGGWYIRGGMYSLASALEQLAKELGVEFLYGTEAAAILQDGRYVRGVRTHTAEFLPANLVVSNADVQYTERQLLGAAAGRNMEASLSGFVLLLGAKRTWPQLAHHNVFFSQDYRAEFDAIAGKGTTAMDPTIYVCNTSVTDPDHAPAGCSNLFVLVNAPPLPAGEAKTPGVDWERDVVPYRDLILRKLEGFGLQGLRNSLEVEHTITPLDFQRKYHAFRGSIYGTSSNSRLAAFLRPPNKSRRHENMYFVGGSSHPGGGIPLVLLSAQIVASMIRREHGTATRSQAALRGIPIATEDHGPGR